MPRRIEKTTFPGSQGHDLAGRLDLPPGEPVAVALFAHCFTCSKDVAAASRISSGLVAEGFAVFRFDFTGLGSSEGEFANTDFSSNVDDLVAAADALRDGIGAPTVLIGHSLGGSAVIAAASRIPEVEAVATIAAPADPAHVEKVFPEEVRQRIREHGEAEVEIAGRSFTVGRGFLDDIAEQPLAEACESLDAALLVLHSPLDEEVGVDHARRIYEAARHPKSYISLDEADHLLTDRRDSAYTARVLAAWASRYLPGATDDDPATAEGEVVVEQVSADGLAQTIRAGHHVLTADEPEGIGDDTGPTPYDLLLAALGACTSMTLGMYARRKEMALDHVRVTLTHQRHHGEDGDHGDGEPGRVEELTRDIEVTGDLSDAERDRLLAIANRCPVHRTLEGDLRITTDLAPAGQDG